MRAALRDARIAEAKTHRPKKPKPPKPATPQWLLAQRQPQGVQWHGKAAARARRGIGNLIGARAWWAPSDYPRSDKPSRQDRRAARAARRKAMQERGK